MKIKKGYIYLTIIALAIYAYFNYQNSKIKEHYKNIVKSFLTDIRREDYFAIHNKLDDNLKKKISVDDIKNYCKSVKITKDSDFKLVNIEKKSNFVKLSGVVTTKNIQNELYMRLKESNNTIKLLYQKIGNSELKEKKESFPIVSATDSKVAN